mmetsp:Transcript_115367/g.322497  ORF Transcript_115367/g.322497 Transcript_115367/m.322497 type:complete len:293 (-) Transcript_115367:511-1389(-)
MPAPKARSMPCQLELTSAWWAMTAPTMVDGKAVMELKKVAQPQCRPPFDSSTMKSATSCGASWASVAPTTPQNAAAEHHLAEKPMIMPSTKLCQKSPKSTASVTVRSMGRSVALILLAQLHRVFGDAFSDSFFPPSWSTSTAASACESPCNWWPMWWDTTPTSQPHMIATPQVAAATDSLWPSPAMYSASGMSRKTAAEKMTPEEKEFSNEKTLGVTRAMAGPTMTIITKPGRALTAAPPMACPTPLISKAAGAAASPASASAATSTSRPCSSLRKWKPFSNSDGRCSAKKA